MDTFLQVFLYLNIFLVGAAVALAVQHALAHFKPHKTNDKSKPNPDSVHLTPEVKAQLLEAAQANFKKILDQSAAGLQDDLKTTTDQMNKQLNQLGTEIINEEMKRYKTSLDELRAQTEITIGAAQKEVEQHQEDLKAKMSERHGELEAKMLEEIETEKQHLLAQIDTKLADAVASFLIETMQHDVDLGAQTPYLTKMLEEHKDEFKQSVGEKNEATATK